MQVRRSSKRLQMEHFFGAPKNRLHYMQVLIQEPTECRFSEGRIA